MASISLPSPPLLPLRLSLRSSSSALTLVPFPFPSLLAPIASTLRSEGVVKVKSHGSPDPALLRKPLASPPPPPQPPPPPPPPTTTTAAAEGREISEDRAADEVAVERRGARGGRRRRGRAGEEEEEEGKLVDWEDLILQDTVPLVGFVRMILHSGKYESGGRFSPEHEKTIIERLLPYHPEYEKKIGCGIDYITEFLCLAYSDLCQSYSACYPSIAILDETATTIFVLQDRVSSRIRKLSLSLHS